MTHAGQIATLLYDGAVLIGGCDNVRTEELYDPTANSFTPIVGVTDLYPQNAILLSDGTVLLAGATTTVAYTYDPASKTFTPTTGNMIAKRLHDSTVLLLDGQVLVGGRVLGRFFP